MTDNNTNPELPAIIEETLPDDAPIDIPSLHDIPRLGPRTIEGLELMLYEGVSSSLAAKRVGLRADNLMRARNSKAVIKHWNHIVAQQRANSAQEAFQRINHLSEVTQSDHVKLEANKWVAGVGGVAPVKRVEGKFSHSVSFGGFEFDDPAEQATDITPSHDSPSGGDDE